MRERATALVNEHLKERPESRIPDVYKLLYQSCMGPGHAMTNCANASTWLMQEWESVRAGEHDKLFENIAIFHPLYRINLGAAKIKGIRPDEIVDAFVSCCNEFPKNPDLFRSIWYVVSENIRSGNNVIPDAASLEDFNSLVKEKKYPAVHHSEEYVKAYRPAYRLVGSEI
jgi:hypothetical protein